MDDVQTIDLGDISVNVIKKNIKNINLSVHAPTGNVRISAPRRMEIETIRIFALSKLSWIKKQQHRIHAQKREAPREYLNRESHYLWGQRYRLDIVEKNAAPHFTLNHNQLLLQVRPGSDFHTKRGVVEDAYRQQLQGAIPSLIARWEPRMGVKVADFAIRKMGSPPDVRIELT